MTQPLDSRDLQTTNIKIVGIDSSKFEGVELTGIRNR